MTLQEFFDVYTVTDSNGGRQLKITSTLNDGTDILTTTDPNGGRFIKVISTGVGSLTDSGAGQTLIVNSSGVLKKLVAGTNISLTDNGTSVTINSTGESALTFSTGLTRTINTVTSNLSTGVAGGQTLIGGTGAGDVLTIKATTAAGTSTTASIVFGVGTNGGTVAAQIYNSGNFNIGNASNTNAKILRIGQSTATVDVGNNSTSAAIWFNQTTPDGTNYGIQGTSSGTIVNATGSIDHRMANSTKYLLTSFAHTFAVSGSASIVTQYSFTGAAVNAQTASTETIGVNFNFAQNIQHATGALPTNRDILFQARTHAFVAASTITNAATVAITGAPTAGTNAIITNPYAFWVQAGTSNFDGLLKINSGVSANGAGFKHSRVTTGSVAGGSTALVTVTWTTAFADTNYTVNASVLDSTATSLSLSVVHIESISASVVTVRVLNNSVGALTGTLHVTACHD